MAILTTFSTFLLLVNLANARQLQKPASAPILNQATSQGCYAVISKSADKADVELTYNNVGLCTTACKGEGKYVALLTPNACYCADTYPSKSDLVEDDLCDFPCPGYGAESCGGLNPDAVTVYNTGVKVAVEHDEESGSATTTSSKTVTSATSADESAASTISSDDETTETTLATTADQTTSSSTPVTTADETTESTSSTTADQVTSTPSPTDVPSSAYKKQNIIGNVVSLLFSFGAALA